MMDDKGYFSDECQQYQIFDGEILSPDILGQFAHTNVLYPAFPDRLSHIFQSFTGDENLTYSVFQKEK